jgi:hypothetical protein
VTRLAGQAARMPNEKCIHKCIKNTKRRRRHRWEDYFKIDFTEIACEDVNWFHPAQDCVQWQAVENTVMNIKLKNRGIS